MFKWNFPMFCSSYNFESIFWYIRKRFSRISQCGQTFNLHPYWCPHFQNLKLRLCRKDVLLLLQFRQHILVYKWDSVGCRKFAKQLMCFFCVCVCVCMCVYVCIYMCVYVCMCIYLCMYVYFFRCFVVLTF